MIPAMADDREDPRSDPRANVFLLAVLSMGSASYPVRVRNLSSNGALLEADSLPVEGEKARLLRGSLLSTGEIAWRGDGLCGIRFDRPIDVREWVRRAGPARQQHIDAAVAEFRGGSPGIGRPVPPSRDRGSPDRDAMASELLRICGRLTTLPGMSTELAEELLRLDAIAQALKKLPDDPR